MGNQASFLYVLKDLGFIPLATLQADMLVPPQPVGFLQGFGLRAISDAPIVDPGFATRNIVDSFVPSTPAAAVAVLIGNGTLGSVTLTNRGLDYIKPPIIKVSAPPGGGVQAFAESFMNVGGVTIASGGASYSLVPHVAFIGGLPPRGYRAGSGRPQCVSNIRILSGGTGYNSVNDTITILAEDQGSPQPTVIAQAIPTIVNGVVTAVTLIDMGAGYTAQPLAFVNTKTGSGCVLTCDMAEGTPAQAIATVAGAIITGFTFSSAGSGYIGVPSIVVTDVTGSGFQGTARMQLDTISVTRPGQGYQTPPTITVTPYFQYIAPTLLSQQGFFFDLMTVTLQQATLSPVIAGTPGIS